jgi:Uma2 family endonuclease
MEKTARRYKNNFKKSEIPRSLIYEEYDGKPLYYQGYKDVLNGKKTIEEIRGESDIQAILVGCILQNLYQTKEENHFVMSNETGFHLRHKTNISSDIVIYEKEVLQNLSLKGKYLEIPPLAVIEVDIQGDLSSFGISGMDYYSLKTRKLLDFGVKEVFWIFSKSKQIFIAKPRQDGVIIDWNKAISILETYTFSLHEIITKEGFVIPDFEA